MLSKLERRFGRFAIPNLTMIIIMCQVVMFFVLQSQPQNAAQLVLQGSSVLAGNVLPLFAFLFLPPTLNLLFAFIAWWIFYLMGSALDQHWGTFRYNVFLLIWYIATLAAAFVDPSSPVTNVWMQGSVFLAFAYLFPDFTFHLFFILPIRVKWLALISWVLAAHTVLFGTLGMRATVIAGVLNFFLYFGKDVWLRLRSRQFQRARKADRIRQASQHRHICEACGITDLSHPKTDFRYCSQCTGTHGYCEDHIRDHEHIRDDASTSNA